MSESELTSSTGSTTSNTNFLRHEKSSLEHLISVKDDKIGYLTVVTRSTEIASRYKRVSFNDDLTQFISCSSCGSLVTYTNNTKSANRHMQECKTDKEHVGKITSHVIKRLTKEQKSDLSIAAANVCINDLRPFNLFGGEFFIKYCQKLIDLAANHGRFDYQSCGPEKTTVKNYVTKQAESVVKKAKEEFKEVKTFAVSLRFLFLIIENSIFFFYDHNRW